LKAFLLIVAITAVGCVNALPKTDLAPVVQAPASQAVPPLAPSSPFPELSGDQTWAHFRSGTLFLDARLPTDYWLGHIPNAMNLPLWDKDFERRLLDYLTGPMGDPNTPVVIYCGGCCSTDSALLTLRLQAFGFKRIQIYRDGYSGWARAGRPIQTGAAPKTMEVK